MFNEKPWPPPWLAFPQLDRSSMGWRMGAGEDYLFKRIRWWRTLTPEQRAAYEQMFPMPAGWDGDDTFRYGDLSLPLWQPEGRPGYTRRWAEEAKRSGTLPPMLPFWGNQPAKDGRITQSCFSQWWASDFRFREVEYNCMEQCMMAGKAKLFMDRDTEAQIMAADDPMVIKKLGRKVSPFDEALWEEAKYSLILNGNYAKFTQNEELRRFLLSTGDQLLVEASPYDTVWGVGLGAEDPRLQDPAQWRGQNLLGFALMEVRDEIRRVYANEHLCMEPCW